MEVSTIRTEEDLYNYVKLLNKKEGHFTADELYEIGKAHKSLPYSEKNWNKLAAIVGYDGGGNALRCFVNNRQRKEGELPMKDLSQMQTNNEQFEESYREKTEIRDIYNNYRSLLRNESRINTFKQAIKDACKSLNSLPNVTYQAIEGNTSLDNEAILMLSDLHLGVECNNFYNTYNKKVARERLLKLAVATIKYCRDNRVGKLNVVNLGDMIHGLIHVTARIGEEMDTVEQLMVASEYIAEFLLKIQSAAPTVIYRSCTDNHSRMVADKSENIEEDNMSRVMDWFLKERLKNTEIIFSNDNIDDSIGKFTLLNGKKVMFAHGHCDSINRSFENFIGASREFIDYGLLAHFHSSKMKEFQGYKVFVNGSIVGTEQYAVSKRLFAEPSQTLLIFDETNIINIGISLK